jgi:hypothetical protein
MAVVAIGAAASGLYEIRRRGQSYRLLARYHLAASRQLANEASSFFCTFGLARSQVEQIEIRRLAERRALLKASEYHRRLYAKYERACEHPWLPVRSDPPAPPGGNPVLVTSADY